MTKTKNNSEYLVTARKWRPLKFSEVVGQEHISKTLKNAIKSNKIHHAYLFSGPRGVGKTTTARIFARAVNCSNPINNEPCNECEACKSILDSASMDVIEIDGASNNSVDDIRKLRENAKYPPINGKYKMYIIDEVHMLSTSAFNALLKTLEEPPKHLLFIFATTEAHKVLPTILSRCQRFDFRRMEIQSIVKQLRFIAANEKINIDDSSLNAIAQKADGSMRDSQSIFDQVVAFCGDNIIYTDLTQALHLIDKEFFFKISEYVLNSDLENIFITTKEIISRGYDLNECLTGLIEHFRNILTVNVINSSDLIEDSQDIKKKYIEISQKFNKNNLLRILNILTKAEQSLKFAPQPRIHFEFALLQSASIDSVEDISELINEIKNIKKKGLNDVSLNKLQSKPTDKRKSTTNTQEKSKSIKISTEANKFDDNANIQQEKFQDSNSSIKDKWEEFKKLKGNSENGLYYLNQDEFVQTKIFKDQIIIYCSTNFIYEHLMSKKVILQEKLFEFFNKNININIVNSPLKEPENIIENENKEYQVNKDKETISSKDTNNNKENLTPIEEQIIRLFGAKKIKSK